MSEEGSFGLSLAERFFGLIVVLVGALVFYFTVTSIDVLLVFTGFFAFLGMILIVLGLVLITAKTE